MQKTSSKRKSRPKRVVPVKLEDQKQVEELANFESEGGFVPPDLEDIKKADQELRDFRKGQWELLDSFTRKNIGMTEEEFLNADDITGFGPGSYFTPLNER